MKKAVLFILIMPLVLFILAVDAYSQVIPLEAADSVYDSPCVITITDTLLPDIMFVDANRLLAFYGDPSSGYTWALSTGSTLPPGVTLDPLGIIHGTGDPLVVGDYHFKMTVSDGSNTVEQKFFYSVVRKSMTLSDWLIMKKNYQWLHLLAARLLFTAYPAYARRPYGATIPVAGGTPPLRWGLFSGSLPPGWHLDAASGVIHGTTDSTGYYGFSYWVMDAAGRTDSVNDLVWVYKDYPSIVPGRQKPLSYQLKQNYPNPFNPTTQIEFALPKAGFVSLRIFNTLGNEVATLISQELHAGTYSTSWNANSFASGVYFCRIEATSVADPRQSFVQVRKMLFIK